MLNIKNTIFILFIIVFINNQLLAELTNNILNNQQKILIKTNNNKPIKLAVMSYWKIDEKGNNGHYKLIDLLKKYGNLDIVPISFNKWDTAYSQAVEANNIDGIMGLHLTNSSKKNDFLYTQPYLYDKSGD